MTWGTRDRRAWTVSALVLPVVVLTLVATLGGSPVTAPSPASAQAEPYQVLFFHRTTGFRHGSIENAIQAVEELGAANGFSVTQTQDPTVFTDAELRKYAAVVFFTDGENTLNHAQRTAFERYLHRGGGFVGLHSTSNMDKADWPWWEELLGGAFFDNHPPIQPATMHVEDATHPATAHLPAQWQWTDEWYNFTADPRDKNVHVVLSVDESTYTGGQMGAGHPIAWCSNYDGGRTFYTAIGHQVEHYDDPLMRGHILGAIRWAAGVVEGDCGEPREGPPTEASFEKVPLDDNTANPMKLDIAPDGRVFYTELGGTLKIWHPDTQAVTVAADIDVARVHENGLLGVALDPDFAQNNFVYLFYSDPATMTVDGTVGGVQHISRFTLEPLSQTLDLASEVVLLEIPHQRQECCHSSGHLEFDSQGNLYASTGDDTNPFASDGYGPFDFRAGRAPWDAARSSANTADLRGKILRINPIESATPASQPGPGSTYTVPDDNLFTAANTTNHHLFPGGVYDPAIGRPEIYTMGHRNPFAIAIDPGTDALWIGQVGPDSNPAGGSNPNRGPRGYDYWTQVRQAGNYGWPFCVVANEPYREWDFATLTPGDFYDCANGPVNESPRNTGLTRLPPVAQLPTIYYPYCNSQGGYSAPVPFPEVPCGPVPGGNGYGTGRAAYAGDVYRFDPELEADGKFPAYFDGKPFLMEWERDMVASISLDDGGRLRAGLVRGVRLPLAIRRVAAVPQAARPRVRPGRQPVSDRVGGGLQLRRWRREPRLRPVPDQLRQGRPHTGRARGREPRQRTAAAHGQLLQRGQPRPRRRRDHLRLELRRRRDQHRAQPQSHLHPSRGVPGAAHGHRRVRALVELDRHGHGGQHASRGDHQGPAPRDRLRLGRRRPVRDHRQRRRGRQHDERAHRLRQRDAATGPLAPERRAGARPPR